MRIAICDDNPSFVEILSEMLDDYSDERKINIEYESFDDYDNISDIDSFNLFILDYNMSDFKTNDSDLSSNKTNGMDFAREIINQSGKKRNIIFISAYPDFVYEAFEVRTYRFLTKPIKKELLFKVLDDFIADETNIGNILIKVKNEQFVINVNDIYYLEVSNKDTFIFFKDHYLKVHKSMSELENDLKDFEFMRIHRSYIINLTKLKSFDMKTVTLDNGEKVFLSQKKYPELCEYFIRHN